MNERQKLITLAAAAGILAGLAACSGQQGTRAAPAATNNGPTTKSSPTTSSESADGRGDLHGCGHHDGGSCGAQDDHKD